MTGRTDKLIQKYLKGKTSREEEKELLDISLKIINEMMVEMEEFKAELMEHREMKH